MAKAFGTHLIFAFLALTPCWAEKSPLKQTKINLPKTAAKLAEARNFVKNQAWPEAIASYQILQNQSATELLSDSEQPVGLRWLRPVQSLVDQDLCNLPVEGKLAYEKAIAAAAEKELKAAQANRSEREFESIIERYLCSSFGATAADWLGRMRFQRGDFRGALDAFRPLLVNPGPHWKNTSIHVYAAEVLALQALGQDAEAEKALSAFELRFPAAGENLVGRKGNSFHSLKTAFLNDHFAIKKTLRSFPTGWKAEAEALDVQASHTHDVGFHNGAFWAKSGAKLLRAGIHAPEIEVYPLKSQEFTVASVANRTFITGQDFSQGELTIVNEGLKIDRRITTDDFNLPTPRIGDDPDPKTKFDDQTFFEGPPAVSENELFVVVTQLKTMTYFREKNDPCLEPVTYIANLNLESGAIRWIQKVSSPLMKVYEKDFRSSRRKGGLITFADGKVFFNDHRGTIGALDAKTGNIQWLVQYPDTNPLYVAHPRQMTGPLLKNKQLLVAPVDYPAVLSLDPLTGKLNWQSDQRGDGEIVHLLGTLEDGRIVITGTQLRLLDPSTGELQSIWPDNFEGVELAGQGLIKGNEVLLPASAGIYRLKFLKDSVVATTITNERSGDLILLEKYLAAVRSDSIRLYPVLP